MFCFIRTSDLMSEKKEMDIGLPWKLSSLVGSNLYISRYLLEYENDFTIKAVKFVIQILIYQVRLSKDFLFP